MIKEFYLLRKSRYCVEIYFFFQGQESFKKQEKTPKTPKGPSSVEDIKAKMQASIEKVSKIIFLKLSGDWNTTVSHFLILIYLPFCGVKFSQKWLTSL